MPVPHAAWGGPAGKGRLRTEPADFRVDEILGFEPDGEGEHALLWIRKRGANTAEVAAALARFAGVNGRAVGFSGRKDRNADTGQWFSVHLAGRDDPDWMVFGSDRWHVERAERHGRRLRTGTHRANRFRLRIRDFRGNRERLEHRMACLARHGFPNYFGPQRFGQEGGNVDGARALLAGRIRPRRGLRGIYLSAARSWLFNRVLDHRVATGCWLTPLADDALMLAGSRSMFRCRGDETDLAARIDACDLHVTGPLWGRGGAVAGPAALARERAWLADEDGMCEGLEAFGMRADRRALRALVTDPAWSVEGDAAMLDFTLPAGSFATALLFELVDTGQA